MIIQIKSVLKKIKNKFYLIRALRNVKQVGNGIIINGKTKFNSNTSIGNNCHFNGLVITGNGEVTIGDNFHSGNDVLLITSNHNYDNGSRLPYDDTIISKKIVISDNCWIGSRVILLPGTFLGEGSIVQAGSVVHGEIPKYAICGGNPAKIFKYRDINHYDELLQNKMFW